MTSQFDFLLPEFAAIHDHAARAETLARGDPRGACFYARFALETLVKWAYRHDGSLTKPYATNLSALIHEPSFRRTVGEAVFTKARLVIKYGNMAVHDAKRVAQPSAAVAVKELFHICYWLAHTYARGRRPPAALQFDPSALPDLAEVTVSTLARLQEAERRAADQAEAERRAEAEKLKDGEARAVLEAEIARLHADIAAAKAANQAAPDAHDYIEAETRDAFIDLLLREAGWPLDQPRDREWRVEGMPNTQECGFVDYVLWGDDGKPLALVEAKRTRRDARVGQQQAKLYANCLEQVFGRRPVIFYTNGYEHWLWEDAFYPPRAVSGFYKKEELMLLLQRRSTRKKLSAVPIDTAIAGRFYQARAIRRVGEVFEKERQRKALLVMATGSGKTRTVIALIDQLMRANLVKRALFLADRVALVNQAVGAFKANLPSVAPVNLVTDKAAEGRVYVSTYPTIMGLIDEVRGGERRFGAGHFDLIVIDEAHRSVYKKYRAIFDWFDALLVGLTATPREEIDRDTYSLFELEKGVPTDSYDLDQAVADGFLVPPRAISVPLKFQRQGIRYDDLSDEEKEQWDAIEWDEDGTVPDSVDAAAVNRWLFNIDTVDKVLEHLMNHGLKVDDGERLGKTIIFARNHDHAMFIADRFDANYPYLAGQFARVIDFKIDYAQSLIDDFSNPAKPPHIAISVDMLDTGIDVPEVVNLVFFKIVRSKTKFWQMLGRGTRLRPDLFGPGRHKENFLVFDFCQNFEYFNQNPVAGEGVPGVSLAEKLFLARLELIGELGDDTSDEELAALREAMLSRLRDEVAGMSLDNFIVRPHRRLVERFQAQEAWAASDEGAHADLRQLAGLPSAFSDDDVAAKQFDLLVLNAELALLRDESHFAQLRERIRSIASNLEGLGNVPMVADQMALILEVQTDSWWKDLTAPMLDEVRRRLRALVKLVELGRRLIVYSDFDDQIGTGTEVTLPMASGTDRTRFRMKVRHFLAQHENHISLIKLRRNEQLTPQDLNELEEMFRSEGVASPEDLVAIREEGGLGLFIRQLIGLDREAAKLAFSEFMAARNLTANQIEFLDLMIDSLTDQGSMEPKRLYESPFTDFDDQGVSGVFQAEDVRALIDVLKVVRNRAAA